jgi:hypothetical protein
MTISFCLTTLGVLQWSFEISVSSDALYFAVECCEKKKPTHNSSLDVLHIYGGWRLVLDFT